MKATMNGPKTEDQSRYFKFSIGDEVAVDYEDETFLTYVTARGIRQTISNGAWIKYYFVDDGLGQVTVTEDQLELFKHETQDKGAHNERY